MFVHEFELQCIQNANLKLYTFHGKTGCTTSDAVFLPLNRLQRRGSFSYEPHYLPCVSCKEENYTINNVLPKIKVKNLTRKYHKDSFFAFSAMQPEFYC